MYSLCVMLWFGTLLKGGLNIPQFLIGPRCHGRVGQKMSCKFFSISTYDYIRIHAYITLMNQSQFCVTLGYVCYMIDHIRHNSLSPIQFLRAFHILFFAYLLFRCYCYNHYKTKKYYFCYRYHYYHITLLQNTLLQILSFQVWLN